MILYEQDEIQDLESLLSDINDEMEALKRKPAIPTKFSSPISALFSGLSGSSGLDFLYSGTTDDVAGKLLDLIVSGDTDKLQKALDRVPELFSQMGVGSGFFKGPIGSTVIENIKASTNSLKFLSTKNKHPYYI